MYSTTASSPHQFTSYPGFACGPLHVGPLPSNANSKASAPNKRDSPIEPLEELPAATAMPSSKVHRSGHMLCVHDVRHALNSLNIGDSSFGYASNFQIGDTPAFKEHDMLELPCYNVSEAVPCDAEPQSLDSDHHNRPVPREPNSVVVRGHGSAGVEGSSSPATSSSSSSSSSSPLSACRSSAGPGDSWLLDKLRSGRVEVLDGVIDVGFEGLHRHNSGWGTGPVGGPDSSSALIVYKPFEQVIGSAMHRARLAVSASCYAQDAAAAARKLGKELEEDTARRREEALAASKARHATRATEMGGMDLDTHTLQQRYTKWEEYARRLDVDDEHAAGAPAAGAVEDTGGGLGLGGLVGVVPIGTLSSGSMLEGPPSWGVKGCADADMDMEDVA